MLPEEMLPFNNTGILKLKAQPTKFNVFKFSHPSIKCSAAPPGQLLTTAERAVVKSNHWAQFRQHSRKLGGAAEHLIYSREKRICLLSFEFKSNQEQVLFVQFMLW